MLRSLAPVFGCGVMMLVCMAVMAIAGSRNRRNEPAPAASADEVATLREEVARLRGLDEQRHSARSEDPR